MPLNDTQHHATLEREPCSATPGDEPLPDIPGYRWVEPLGEGAMGSVLLAIEENLGRRVAIKLMTEEFAETEGALEQFEREAKTMATVEHPHVVRVYAFGDAGTPTTPRPYLAMEFVEGETLEDRIARSGRLGVEESLRIAGETVQALRAAWRQRVVHRDMKPANILLDGEGRVRVGDFGIAKPLELGDGALTATGITLGTPRYVSPEQALGEALDFRSDMYSVGVLLWECLVGWPPFRDTNPMVLIKRHLIEELPTLAAAGLHVCQNLEHLVRKMTAKEPENRYTSYDELLDAIESALQPDEEGAQGPPSTSRAPGWYYARGRAFVGPVERETLDTMICSGEIPARTYVWGPGFEEWKFAEELGQSEPAGASTGAHMALSLLSPRGKASSILEEMAQTGAHQALSASSSAIREMIEPDPDCPAPEKEPEKETEEEEETEAPTAHLPIVVSTALVLQNGASAPHLESAPAAGHEATEPQAAAEETAADTGAPLDDYESREAQPCAVAPIEEEPAVATLDGFEGDSEAAEETKPRPDLDHVLGMVDAKLDLQRMLRVRKGIRASSVKYRFDELKKESIRPALRSVMASLHSKGHPTRLNDVDRTTIRLEFVLDSRTRCRLEISLTNQSTVAFRFMKNMAVVLQHEVPADDIESTDVDGMIVGLLSRGIGRT